MIDVPTKLFKLATRCALPNKLDIISNNITCIYVMNSDQK